MLLFLLFPLLAIATDPDPMTLEFWENQSCNDGNDGTWPIDLNALTEVLEYQVQGQGSFGITTCNIPCITDDWYTDSSNDPICATKATCTCSAQGNRATYITISNLAGASSNDVWCGNTAETIEEPLLWTCKVSADTSDLEYLPNGGWESYMYFDKEHADASNNVYGGKCTNSDELYVCAGGSVSWTGNVQECNSQGGPENC